MDEVEKQLSNIQQEMKRGTLVLAVMLLVDEAQYGYSLLQSLQDAGIAIEQNTLYPLLRRLEKQLLLESVWELEENRPRRYYKNTEKGKQLRSVLIQEWRKLNETMNELIGGSHD